MTNIYSVRQKTCHGALKVELNFVFSEHPQIETITPIGLAEKFFGDVRFDVVVTFSAILLFRSSWILGKSQHRINFRDSVNVLWTY